MNGYEKTFAEFFAGIGLMRVGLEKAGWRVAFANDIDADKRQMYRDHFGENSKLLVKEATRQSPQHFASPQRPSTETDYRSLPPSLPGSGKALTIWTPS